MSIQRLREPRIETSLIGPAAPTARGSLVRDGDRLLQRRKPSGRSGYGSGQSGSGSRQPGVWFECAVEATYPHEWIHTLEWAMHYLSRFDDVYNYTFPACGAGGDPSRWFPSADQCTADPDYVDCGASDCRSSSGGFNEHILTVHLPRAFPVVANHCRNGALDYGEFPADRGGNCL